MTAPHADRGAACAQAVEDNRFLSEPVRWRIGHHSSARAAAQFIGSRLHGEISLEEIANAVHMNKHALCNFFARSVGITVFELVRAMRIYCAVRLLEATRMPVAALARTAGYESVSSFSRAFKSVTGVSPRGYLRRHCSEIHHSIAKIDAVRWSRARTCVPAAHSAFRRVTHTCFDR
jgi:AraC-like DNA-binding protein